MAIDRRLIVGKAPDRMLHAIDMAKRNGPGIELLADPTRRRIIAALALCPRRPSSLATELGLSRPATTRQLNLLRDADLVRASRSMIDGRARVYRIEVDAYGPITAWLAGTDIGRTGARLGRQHRGLPR